MITIKHTYTDTVMILYSNFAGNYTLKEEHCGTMDDIAEHVCDVLTQHNFNHADVCSDSTGEVLMIIKRT